MRLDFKACRAEYTVPLLMYSTSAQTRIEKLAIFSLRALIICCATQIKAQSIFKPLKKHSIDWMAEKKLIDWLEQVYAVFMSPSRMIIGGSSTSPDERVSKGVSSV